MVTKAIDEGLLRRIQNYVAVDVNSKLLPNEEPILPQDVYITLFSRVLNNWKAFVAIEQTLSGGEALVYEIVHDGLSGLTLAKVFRLHSTQEAII